MFDIMIYDKLRTEANSISDSCLKHINTKRIKNVLVRKYYDHLALYSILSTFSQIMLYMIKKDEYLEMLSDEIRRVNDLNYIVLVVEKAEDLFGYVSTSTTPAAILPAAPAKEQVSRVIEEIYADYSRLPVNEDTQYVYRFKMRSIDYKVPFSAVYLIEVQSKKITIRTKSQVFDFYDSLENVLSCAPDYFLRVHRSFVVNTRFIDRINYSEKVIYMTDGSQVYFSRSYSPAVKMYMSESLKENVF